MLVLILREYSEIGNAMCNLTRGGAELQLQCLLSTVPMLMASFLPGVTCQPSLCSTCSVAREATAPSLPPVPPPLCTPMGLCWDTCAGGSGMVGSSEVMCGFCWLTCFLPSRKEKEQVRQ